jgi:hypothetical protein
MIKINLEASIAKIVSNESSPKNEKKDRKARESKSSVNHDKVDLEIFRAILRATALDIKQTLTEDNRAVRNGILVSGLLLNLPKFQKNDPTNRAIVLESISSLQERSLVRSIDHGKFQFVSATNGGHYYVAPDGRVVTNFFGRNKNPLVALFEQMAAKSAAQTETVIEETVIEETVIEETVIEETVIEETEVTDFSGMEPYEEPGEIEDLDDSEDCEEDSGLNSDTPEE